MIACLLSRSRFRTASSLYHQLSSTSISTANASRCSFHTSPPITPIEPATETLADSSNYILKASMEAIDSLHTISGLPWWASIVTLGVGVRLSLLPITLRGMKAGGALVPLFKQARQEVEFELKSTPLHSQPVPGSANLKTENTKSIATNSIQNFSLIASKFHQLRVRQNAPHPFWIIGSPLLQLPVFITAMASIQSMSLSNWPGFCTGGTAWFPNLTQGAMDLSTMTAPMGPYGIVLPLYIALAMYSTIDVAFTQAVPNPQSTIKNKSESPLMDPMTTWLLGKIRLALEWCVVPLFVTALQLPYGALCYWSASSTMALLQSRILKIDSVRRRIGMSTRVHEPSDNVNGMVLSNMNGDSIERGDKSDLRKSNQIPEEAVQLLVQAAEYQAKGDGKRAETILESILDKYPLQPRVLFALGQVQSGLKQWETSAESYLEAANYELDAQQRCRAWFGAGVALHMLGKDGDAVIAFGKAAAVEAGKQMQVRAWVSQATLSQKMGKIDDAVRILRKAAEYEPKVEEIYLNPLLKEGK